MFAFIQNIVFSHPYLVALGVLVAIYYYFYNNPCDLPGPYGVPFAGYLPFLGDRPYETFTKIGKEYGEVFQLRFGPKTVIILNSVEAINEAYGNDLAFAGRPNTVTMKTIQASGPARFAFRPANETWRFLRRVAAKSLGLFASSRNSKLEGVVHDAGDLLGEEIEKNLNKSYNLEVVHDAGDLLEEEIEKNLGKVYNPKVAVGSAVSSVIGSVLFGFEFERNHPLVKKLVGLVPIVSRFLAVGSAVDNLPFGKFLMRKTINEFLGTFGAVNDTAEHYLNKHEYVGDEDNVRDVADALTKVAGDITPAEMAKHGVDSHKIKHIASDLFGAGFATTMDSCRWFLNLMAYFPRVQMNFQKQLDDSLNGRRPELTDRGRMPYVDATMQEMFRFASLIPFGLPHAIMSDTTFRGYTIPKGAFVFANLYGIHHDYNLFPEPFDLKPERFLRPDGSYNPDLATNVIPFATGKRRCVGESLARQELFILITTTLQKYNVEVAPGQDIDIHTTSGGFTRMPHDWNLIFTKRTNGP